MMMKDQLDALSYEIRDYKQLRSYLKLMNKPLGWLINFNENNFAHGMIKVPNRFYNP
jgi:hypothetical protein